MSAFMRLVTLDVRTVEHPNEVLNAVDEALKEMLQDPDRTLESELRIVKKCTELLEHLHTKFTPAEYRRLLD